MNKRCISDSRICMYQNPDMLRPGDYTCLNSESCPWEYVYNDVKKFKELCKNENNKKSNV